MNPVARHRPKGNPVVVREAHNNPATRWNADYIEELYSWWREDPSSVPASWNEFFKGYSLGLGTSATASPERQSQVASLIYAYRSLGHRIAQKNPLGGDPTDDDDLAIANFGFDERDLDSTFDTGHLHLPQTSTLQEILSALRETYCRSIGVEYLHIQDVEVRRWLQQEMEPIRNRPTYEHAHKMEILGQLIDAEVFERFIHTRYPGQKRFSLEGAETMIPALRSVIDLGPSLEVEEVVVGMAHRGRLNVLANVLQKSYAMIFSEFDGNTLPNSVSGDGDVKYHLGFTNDCTGRDGRTVHVSLTPNPSHLEAVNPVVEGRARAKQRQRGDTVERKKVVPILIHGDAAFAGQGLVAETLNLSQLTGYRTGGTVHLIVNNQIGFTTSPMDGRSTSYCTDVAKMVEAPIFHVNGDDPEAVVHAMGLALRFRQAWGRDVVVDMYCYRRHGHNEGDEPGYTQPQMYRTIKDHASVREIYTQQLIDSGDLERAEEERIETAFRKKLQDAFDEVRERHPPVEVQAYEGLWLPFSEPWSADPVDTRVPRELIDEVARGLARVPDDFNVHPKLERIVRGRRERVESGEGIDWGLGEALAFGTLILEGNPVRLSGQDSARGTFSHRHAAWIDTETAEKYVPLKHLRPDQPAGFCVYNSMLSEAAVLGFDFGYSLAEPRMLILWEAQFGDFANGAQVIIDQFIVNSQSKWQRTSGLVMLLPHGYEGQGPEHSNAYLERYLAACAEKNIQVCNLTTPANYFHALRRQVRRPFRRPLIVMAPKSLLRHKEAVSTVDELVDGSFHEVIDDPRADEKGFAAGVRRVVLCSGKVYYDLLAKRRETEVDDVALVRVEQIYPFPGDAIGAIVARYTGVEDIVWVQEESQNRGAWTFIAPRLATLFPDAIVRYIGRAASASPASGSVFVHRREQEQLVEAAVNGWSDRSRTIEVDYVGASAENGSS